MGKKSKSRARPSSGGEGVQVDGSGGAGGGDNAQLPPFELCKVEMSMALPPKALEDVEDAVACKLQGRVMRYNEEVEGVVIAFKNVAIRSPKAHIFNELPTLHIGVNAELLVFSPVRGGHLRGVVNMVSSQHIGLLVLGAFNATLPANELPPPYSYSQGDEAWYGEGEEEGAVLRAGVEVDFVVNQLTVTNDLITITGSLRGEGTGPVGGDAVELAAPAVHFLPTTDEGAEQGRDAEEQEQEREEQVEATVGRAKKRSRRDGAAQAPTAGAGGDGDTPTAKRRRAANGAVKEEPAAEALAGAAESLPVDTQQTVKSERKDKKKKKKKEKKEKEEGASAAAGGEGAVGGAVGAAAATDATGGKVGKKVKKEKKAKKGKKAKPE